MTWFIKMPDGSERPATEDEVIEIEDPRWGALRKGALTGLNLMAGPAGGDPNQPAPMTTAIRNALMPRDPNTAASMYSAMALQALSGGMGLPWYVRAPAVIGGSAAANKLMGGSASKGAEQGILSEVAGGGGKMAGGVVGRLFRGSRVPSQNVADRVAEFIGAKIGVKMAGRDVEPLLVRGGSDTGLAAIARGNQKPAAQLLKRVFHDGWDYERGEVDQPALVNSIVHDHWDELVHSSLGKRGAQDLLNAVSGYPSGTLPAEAEGRLAALPSESAGVSLHPPYHLRVHPFRTYRPPGPLDRFWSPQSESIMRGFATGSAAQAMPYLAPEGQIPPTPSAAPTPAPRAIPAATPAPAARPTPTPLPRRAPSLASLFGPTSAYAQEVPGEEILDPIFDPAAEAAVTYATSPLQEKAGQVMEPVVGPAGSRDLAKGLMAAANLYSIGKLGGQGKRLVTDPGGLARDVSGLARRATRPTSEGIQAFVRKYGVSPKQAADIMTDTGWVDPHEITRAGLQVAKEHGPATFKAAVQKLFSEVGGDEAMAILKPFYSSPEAQELFQNWQELVP